MMKNKHTEETKRKISDGVKRHYDNMSAEDKETRSQKIAEFRRKENRVYHFCKDHKDFIKRVLDEIKAEREQQRLNQ